MKLPEAKSRSVILFSTADWDNPFWTNKQHTAVQLAELGYKVFYIESMGLRRPKMKGADLLRIFRRLIKSVRGVRSVQPNLHVYSPLVIPFHRFAFVQKLNFVLLRFFLKRHQARLSLKNPIIWTYNPMVLPLMKELRGSKLVYHSVDDLSAAPGVDRDSILKHEDELLRAVDFVFCTSRKIEARCRSVAGDRVYFFPNVVDEKLFSKARTPIVEPDDLKGIPHPRVGFVGAMSSYKVDFEAILSAVILKPDWHWILIGKVGEGQPEAEFDLALVSLLRQKNVHCIGPRKYEDLPNYLRYFDVVIIPSPLNEYTNSMFPMKFFEYMAAGKPIVASKIDSLKEYDRCFYSYGSAEEFQIKITEAIECGVPNSLECDALVKENTWERRLMKMLALLGEVV